MAAQTNRTSRDSNKNQKRLTLTGIRRWMRFKSLLLFRAQGGAVKVSIGFSIGLAIEMFTLPTFGFAFFLIFPIVYLFRASLAGALAGFVFGKIIYIPVAFFNNKVGEWVVPVHFHEWISFLPDWLEKMMYMNIKLIAGGMIDGVILGFLFYLPVKWLLEFYTAKRTEKRKLRRAQLLLIASKGK